MQKSLIAAAAAICLVSATSADAGFIVEAGAGGLANANYDYTGAGGTAASASSAGVFAPGTSGVGSIFGGDGTTDEYTFAYTPATDTDNATYLPDEVLNSFWNPDGVGDDEPLTATGLGGGAAGLYNVYATYPQSGNLSAGNQPVTFTASGDAGDAVYVVDQDSDSPLSGTLDTGVAIGLWELVGTVQIDDPSSTYTVVQSHTGDAGFVSMRGYGVLWEYAGPIPEPASLGLLSVAGLGLMRRRK